MFNGYTKPFVFMFCFAALLTEIIFGQSGASPQYVEGHFLVKINEGVVLNLSHTPEGYLEVGIEEIDSLNVLYQVTGMEPFFSGPVISEELYRWLIFETDYSGDLLPVCEVYQSVGDIQYAEPNYIVELFDEDPQYNKQWGLNNTGQTGGTPDADIDAWEAISQNSI